MKNIIFLLVVLNLMACSKPSNQNSSVIIPLKAIELSNQSAPNPISGTFEINVKACLTKHGMIFLSSESDPKDQRSLIIAMRPKAVKQFIEKYGVSPSGTLIGKRIQIKGEAIRIKYWDQYKNKRLKSYHYQTQVFINSLSQLTVLS